MSLDRTNGRISAQLPDALVPMWTQMGAERADPLPLRLDHDEPRIDHDPFPVGMAVTLRAAPRADAAMVFDQRHARVTVGRDDPGRQGLRRERAPSQQCGARERTGDTSNNLRAHYSLNLRLKSDRPAARNQIQVAQMHKRPWFGNT
jgi:hypothetical protein